MRPAVTLAVGWSALVILGVALLAWRGHRKAMQEIDAIEAMWRRTP